ncbi:MAG: hypothetical protein JXL84_02525 [Deltaproteobacteria bacterium]|nr:hypothetical protein [Deltaproteobacteria bacterium]
MRDAAKWTAPGSLVLIHYQDKPTVYARVEAVEPDVKKEWFQVTLLLLTIPAKNVTWILRREYIEGNPFTMGGQSMRLETIPSFRPATPSGQNGDASGAREAAKPGKVIPFKKEP